MPSADRAVRPPGRTLTLAGSGPSFSASASTRPSIDAGTATCRRLKNVGAKSTFPVGVRTITFNAPIPRESVRYYHDMADTIDKLPEQIVVDSTAIIGDLVLALAEDATLSAFRRPSDDTKKLFTTFGLEPRLRGLGLWACP